MGTVDPNVDDFLLGIYRETLSEDEKLKSIIKEICVFDSIHDFSSTFYDSLPMSKSIAGYGDYNPSIFVNAFFTYVNDTINPIKTNENMHTRFQQNNKVYGGALGLLNAIYTKSKSNAKANIEKYYLDEIEKLDIFKKVEILTSTSDEDVYTIIAKEFKEYSQFQNSEIEYIPIVVDVQKRLFLVLKKNSDKIVDESGKKLKIAYVLNREVMNDAAGKINFKEPVKRKYFNFFVDIDQKDISYSNSDRISIGFDNVNFSSIKNHNITRPDGVTKLQNYNVLPTTSSASKKVKPWCEISFPKDEFNYQTIINDSSINSITNAKRGLRKFSSLHVKSLIDEQNRAATKLNDITKLLKPGVFQENYKTEIVKNILEYKSSNKILSDYATIIFFLFLRKRLGDQLQALSCLKKRKYGLLDKTDDTKEILKFEEDQTKPFIFCSYDVIAVAFALANKIPCILEKADKTMVLYIPKTTVSLPDQSQFGGSSRGTPRSAPRGASRGALFTRLDDSLSGINNFDEFAEALISAPLSIVRLLKNVSEYKSSCTNILKDYYNDLLTIRPFITSDNYIVNVLTTEENLLVNPEFNPIDKSDVVTIIELHGLKINCQPSIPSIYNLSNRDELRESLKGLFEIMIENGFENDSETVELLFDYSQFNKRTEGFATSYLNGGGKYKKSMIGGSFKKQKKLDKKFVLSILQNNELYTSSENINIITNYIFQKIFYIYEQKLVLDVELFEMNFDTSKFPEIAENREIYCITEVVKNKNINILVFLNFLTKIRETNNFAENLLSNLGDITDYVFDTLNHEFVNIISKQTLKKTKEVKQLLDSSIKIYESNKDFDASYFSEIYNNITIPNLYKIKQTISIKSPYLSLTNVSASNRRNQSLFSTLKQSGLKTYKKGSLLNTAFSKTLQPILAYGKKSKKNLNNKKKRTKKNKGKKRKNLRKK